jgi:para-aminobenzoate synthetase component 1
LKARVASFQVTDIDQWKQRAFHWASAFSPFCYLDSNGHEVRPGRYECLIGAGAVRNLKLAAHEGAFSQWQAFWENNPSWLFGHLSYDLKNDVEKLHSRHSDPLGFPVLHFFEPEYLLELMPEGRLNIHTRETDPQSVWNAIEAQNPAPAQTIEAQIPPIRARMSAETYRETVLRLQHHILEGDIYEANLCQEFFSEGCILDPLPLFLQLNRLANAPFSACYEVDGRYLLCASPERFLHKQGDLLTSQPIKGTRRRGRDAEEDQILRDELLHSEKDRAENVMIVDLVRNDLARSCQPGTVRVPELFGIHAFPQVFQMISTVEGRLRKEVSPFEAIRRAFPMGSMTGAPKVMAMELIERYENARRGLYSGAVGYLTPEGDFDFNVVIRSLLYNRAAQYLSFQVGGAIVYDSVPELEYEECGWKARALLTVLGQGMGSMTNPRAARSSQKRG